jgi:hypothetical protein
MDGATVPSGITSRPAPRFFTAFRLQAIEYGHRRLLLGIVLAMPVLFFVLTYYTAPEMASQPLLVPEHHGATSVDISPRLSWSLNVAIMGVAWALGVIGFFAVMGNLRRDRRLVLSGYAAWEVLVARLAVLAAISAPVAIIGMAPAVLITSLRHPDLVPLANLCAAFIAAGFGMLVGTVLPRPTEGVLIVILVIGVGVPLGGDAMKYFFLYPTIQLQTVGWLARDPWPFPFLWQSGLVLSAFLGPSLLLWWRRTRLIRHPGLTP